LLTALAKIGGTIRLRRADAPALVESLDRMLTRPNPIVVKRRRMRQNVDAFPPFIRAAVDGDDGTLFFPRGCAGAIRSEANRMGYVLSWDRSAVVYSSFDFGFHRDLRVDLRTYQRDVVEAMVTGTQGIAVMPTGSGKTIVGCAAINEVARRALVVVHTKDLALQWKRSVEKATSMAVRVVTGDTPGGATMPAREGEVVVASVQSLIAAGSACYPLLRSVDAMVMDECHHAPAMSFVWVLQRCPARYRWGLSATPDREDGLTFVMEWHLGKILASVPLKDLEEKGFVVVPIIVPVHSGWASTEKHIIKRGPRRGQLNWSKAEADLSHDPKRLATIISLARGAHEAGRRILVLVPRVQIADVVAKHLVEHGIRAMPATSQITGKKRDARIGALRTGQIDVLVATTLADEGLDISSLNCIISANPNRSRTKAIQRLGRLTRPEGEPPILVDMVDGGKLVDQWEARKRIYEVRLGARILDVMTVEDAIVWMLNRKRMGAPGPGRTGTTGRSPRSWR